MTDFKQPYPKHNPIHCDSDWHFSQSALMLCIYHLAGSITHGGTEGRLFFVKPKNISVHFGYSYDSTLRAIKMLRRQGWLIQQKNNRYAFVDHKTWVLTHPAQCVERELMPWQETLATTDQLCRRLFAASTGRLRLNENFLRKFHTVNEDELVAGYVKELAAMKVRIESGGDRTGTGNESCLWRVFKHLKGNQNVHKEAEQKDTHTNAEQW
jgi:hypothetical protein